MVQFGLSLDGIPFHPTKELPEGWVVPDASVAELEESLRREVDDQIDAGVAADDLGFDYVLTSEHHGRLQTTVTPNPVLTQTAIARATEHVRLLQMANILPWHEPVRLAEQTAMLDVVSDGRAEVGVGWGTGGSVESETLGQYWGASRHDELKNEDTFEEKLDIIRGAWTESLLDYDGQFHHVPPSYTRHEHLQKYHYLADDVSEFEPDDYFQLRDGHSTLAALPVVPTPQQDPHPQLWKPAVSGPSIQWAAERGMNACTHCSDYAIVAERVATYHECAAEAGWPDRRPEYDGEPLRYGWDEKRRRGMPAIVAVTNTDCFDEETHQRWREGEKLALSQDEGGRVDPGESPDLDVDEHLAEHDAPVVGDTEAVVDELATFAETVGYEDLVLFVNFESPGLTHDDHLDQIRTFAEDVMPYFEDRAA